MRHTNTHVYFWEGTFSNWDNCHFDDHSTGIHFHNTEQAFMWQKARFFGDIETQKVIESVHNPKEVKLLGRKILGYNEQVWQLVRGSLMAYVNYLKFTQNAYYNLILVNTGDKILVEASPYDKIWGVGLAQENDLILDEKNWLGQNLLGKALMEVRKVITKA